MTEFFIKLGLPAVLILLSKFVDIFYLPAPGSWLQSVAVGLRYFAAIAGAALAHATRPRKTAILLPIFVVIGSAFGYQYVIQHPPTESEKTWWTLLMPITFFLAYFATGFLVSAVLGVIWPNRDNSGSQPPKS